MSNHDQLNGKNIHVPHSFEFLNAEERSTTTGFTVDDLKKLALQLDNMSLWQLETYAPIKWVHIADTSPNFENNVDNLVSVSTAYAHALETGNAHGLTKANLGLDNVPNVDCTNASNITTGTLPSSVIPPIAISSTYVIDNEAAQLALSAQEGDVAIRPDLPASYIHNGGAAGTMADWTAFKAPTDLVLSVNSKTGAIILNQDDINDGTTYVRTTNDFTDVLKTKLDGVDQGANNYTHPTAAGNKHIPTGGQSGQVLSWLSDGTVKWENTVSSAVNDSIVRRTGTGEIHASGFNSTSSRKYKENIVEYKEDAQELIDQIKVVSYNYIEDKAKTPKVGFIAEDTDTLLSTPAQDSMDVTNVLGVLLKAVQQMNRKLEALEDRLDDI